MALDYKKGDGYMNSIKESIINILGKDIYLGACKEAALLAPDLGKSEKHRIPEFASIPHDIFNKVDELVISSIEKVNVLFDFYSELPTYGILMYISFEYTNADNTLKRYILSKLYDCLTTCNPIFITPVEYTLWCDYFEDYQNHEFAWNYLIELSKGNKNVIKSILLSSGPVTFSLKEIVYKSLIKDKEMHEYIFESLIRSKFDLYGSFNKKRAKKIFSKLKIDKKSKRVHLFLKVDKPSA